MLHVNEPQLFICASAIDPNSCEEHKEYIDRLCADFEDAMKSLIDTGIRDKESSSVRDPLFEEVVQHTTFCQAKCKLFYGRKETIKVQI